MNLIMNSIDAMKDLDQTRELSIRSQNAGDRELMISVSDNGVGLPRYQPDQIFEAFFMTKPNGIGMGLRISRTIVDRTAADCGRLTTLRAGRASTSLFPRMSSHADSVFATARAHTNV